MLMTVDRERQRLLAAWQQLTPEDQRTVRLFAEFLGQQATALEPLPPIPQEPLPIPKPERESAVLALKRLKKTYPMIETDFSLLEKASQILLKKVLGTADAEVIAEMEELFEKRYQGWKNRPGLADQ